MLKEAGFTAFGLPTAAHHLRRPASRTPPRHGDAFADLVGAGRAVSAWRRHQITTEASPSKISRALAAVTLMYQLAELRSLSTGPHLLAR